ncbi:XRE family transcriptional regulator [Actinomadura spongiicola]|uniref:XRE family transcriptional regulator n=1 Tax=Actinomadura spongiicola TaxID=2303421 RepID=A0A372GMX9_9ACTN|nr:helix-turn-helix transcriptional regulator [Actinomadura spongiicola]RFS86413.1 XRE family transcriptional regulator [Actinomadura spongiicola]
MSFSPSSSVRAAREELAARLRELRLDAELTGKALAGKAGWHRTKVSQIEHAVRAPSRSDVRTWCRICEAADEAEDLIARLRDAESGYVEWKRLQRTGLKRLQESAQVEFDECRHLRAYCSRAVPGLLQTAEYTSALLGLIQRFRELPDDVEAAVTVRRDRKRVLTKGNHRFAFVIEESVLRYRIGGAEIMAGQLSHLLTVMTLPSVSLGIIPFAAMRTATPRPDFTMFDVKNVQVELPSALVTVTAPGEIVIYAKAFEELAEMAVTGAPARALISSAIEELG